ncbi:hypothetical protein PM082_014384 [Marasmius tenuissimus]|nr:hypothetical protein PM082_014384 [Marasmius tenuissimus]
MNPHYNHQNLPPAPRKRPRRPKIPGTSVFSSTPSLAQPSVPATINLSGQYEVELEQEVVENTPVQRDFEEGHGGIHNHEEGDNSVSSAAKSMPSMNFVSYDYPPGDYPKSKWGQLDKVLSTIEENFPDLGMFLEALFENFPCGVPNPCTNQHTLIVKWFLQGDYTIKAVDVVHAIYRPRYSYPISKSSAEMYQERTHSFSPTVNLTSLHYARPAMSAWATQLIGHQLSVEMETLCRGIPSDPDFPIHLTGKNISEHTSTSHVFEHFSLKHCVDMYKCNACLAWYMTKCISCPKTVKDNEVRAIRLHPMIQVISLSVGLLSQNLFANGFLTFQLGVWFFSMKAHIDTKRVMCRIGISIADSTIRQGLRGLGKANIQRVHDSIDKSVAQDTDLWSIMNNSTFKSMRGVCARKMSYMLGVKGWQFNWMTINWGPSSSNRSLMLASSTSVQS